MGGLEALLLANSMLAAMSTRSSPPYIKSGIHLPLSDPFEHRIHLSHRILAFWRPAKFMLFFGCLGRLNSLIPRKIPVIRGVTNLQCSAQIGAGRFVDQLSDDRLALGDLLALSIDGRDYLLVDRRRLPKRNFAPLGQL